VLRSGVDGADGRRRRLSLTLRAREVIDAVTTYGVPEASDLRDAYQSVTADDD